MKRGNEKRVEERRGEKEKIRGEENRLIGEESRKEEGNEVRRRE